MNSKLNINNVPYFAEDGGKEVFPDPVPFGVDSVPEINSSILPVKWLADFVASVSASAQVPESMSVAVALSTVSTCLQKSIEVSPFDDYSEPVNIWTVVQLPPGSRKSKIFTAFTDPLVEWEEAREREMQSEIHESETKRTIALKQIDRLQNEAAKADDPHDREIKIVEINRIKEKLPEPVRAPKLWTGDVTPEQLQNLLFEQGERMSVLADEAAIFEIMAGLYSDGRANLDVFLQGHAGSPVRVDRATRQVRLNKPALTFGLTVQPQVLSELASGNKKRFRGIGLLARFLYFAPKSNIGRRDIRTRRSIPADVRLNYQAGIARLLSNRSKSEPVVLSLDDDALELWLQFSEYLEENQGEGKPLECIQDWSAKLAGAALRIAGLFHACESTGSTVIGVQSISAAINLCKLLIPHAMQVFDQMGTEQSINDAKHVCNWITRTKVTSFKTGDLYAIHRFKQSNKARIDSMIGILAERFIIDHGTVIQTGGRPSHLYRVNPGFLKSH